MTSVGFAVAAHLLTSPEKAIDPARVTAFTFGVSAILFVVMLAISLALVGRELQTRSPWIALRRARARLRRVEPIPAPRVAS